MWKNQDGEKFNRNVFSNNLAYSNGIWGNSYKNVYHKAINKPIHMPVKVINQDALKSDFPIFFIKILEKQIRNRAQPALAHVIAFKCPK